MSQLTKKAIKQSFMKLLNQTAFDKITVKDIVKDCGVNRNTFYYHYQDIYELLREILREEAQKVVSCVYDYNTWQEAILEATEFVRQNKKAAYHLYNSISRRDIEKYLYDVIGKITLDFVQKQESAAQACEEDIRLIVDFYKCALVGLFLEWMDRGMQEEPEIFVCRIAVLMEGTINSILQRTVKKQDTLKKDKL